MVALLVKGGANVNVVSSHDPETPLDMAINNGRTEIANLLKQHGEIELRGVRKR